MSAIAVPSRMPSSRMPSSRPSTITWAVALLIIGAISAVATFPLVDPDNVSVGLIAGGTIFGVASLAGAWGLWHFRAWGAWLSFILTLLNGLAAAPGVAFAPGLGLRLSAILGVVLAIAICWLIMTPSARAVWRRRKA